MQTKIKQTITESSAVKQAMLEDDMLIGRIEETIKYCLATYKAGGKLLFCGNGGSAADAQHIAAEFTGRFFIDRPPLNAEALHVNSSFMTAVANDYGYEEVYARMVKGVGQITDILFAISTSGNSPNIVLAARQAKDIGMKVIAMTGESGGELAEICDILLNVPSKITPRIQESHILLGHVVCEEIEAQIFGKK